MKYSFTNVWGQSWALYKKSWTILSAACVIYFLANIPAQAVNILRLFAQSGEPKPEPTPATAAILGGLGCFSAVWAIFVILPIAGGLYWMGTRASRAETPTLSDILQGYRRFPALIGAFVLLCVVLTIPVLLALMVSLAIVYLGIGFEVFKDGVQRTDFDDCSRAAIALGALWTLACLVVMYWIAIRTVFVWLIVTDESLGKVGPVRAIELSWRITRGNALSLFGLFMTIGIMLYATLLCCVLPILFVGMPLAFTQFGVAYNLLLSQDRNQNQFAPTAA